MFASINCRNLFDGGGGYGYSTMQAWLPECKIGVVVLANAGDIGFSDELAHEVLRKMVEIKNPSAASKIKGSNQNKSFAPESGDALRKFEGNYKTYGRVVGVMDGEDSVHPAYPFRMTARDMARFGLLYLRGGKWCGRQIISEKWIKESTTAHGITNYKNGVGYSYL